MASSTILIVDRDGRDSLQATADYRPADAGAENTISDSLPGALAYARRTVPNHPQAVWAIWSTGTGRFAVREAVPRNPQ